MVPRKHQSSYAPQPAPSSSHLADPFLLDFLNPDFDPVQYLNRTLPPLSIKSVPGTGPLPASSQHNSASSTQKPVSLADLSTQTTSLVTQLNAHTTRLANTLTQLTDDILRSGSRLAYEVELLRGETLTLTETLTERLGPDIEQFVPGGLPARDASKASSPAAVASNDAISPLGDNPDPADPEEPGYVKQLRTLTLVRARLDSVIKTFGDAMDFTFPPSELSTSSSFLSVSAPEPGSQQQSTEEKGQEVLRKLRDEIASLLAEKEDPVRGIEKAAERIEELKELCVVWNGTAEEKGRAKFMESLARMVEDRHKELVKELELATKREAARTPAEPSTRSVTGGNSAATRSSGGYGLLSQLQKMRAGI